MKASLALALLIPLAACASTANGPSRLTGQELDAAVALYGPWAEQIELDGKPLYIWRRRLIQNGESRYCELRIELGFRQVIRQATMQGLADACKLFAVRSETLSK
jgi:hypothetical protein